jgi:hypothetical protein
MKRPTDELSTNPYSSGLAPTGQSRPAERAISAIVLVAVYGDKSEVYGILHPGPTYPLRTEWLPKIPFVRISRWPITDGKIFTEWVVGSSSGYSLPHLRMRSPKPPREPRFQQRGPVVVVFKTSPGSASPESGSASVGPGAAPASVRPI